MALKSQYLKEPRQRRYLSKDFDSFKADLLETSKQYYSDKVKDFSESGITGLFLDLAASVGDNLSFYLDHQYGELDPNTAFETSNIERHLTNSGVKIPGAAPAIIEQTFYVQVPASLSGNSYVPLEEALPIIQAGTRVSGDNGVSYTLLKDLDYSLRKNGKLVATVTPGKLNASGIALTYVLSLTGIVVSGEEVTETFDIDSTFVPFRQITLSNPNVSQIISVSDTLGNDYYEVSSLTDDVVYKVIPNVKQDFETAPDTIKIVPAPYRFTTTTTLGTRQTVLMFGGGNAETLEDDILPDPSAFAINYAYKQTFSREPLNPNNIISSTKTLGVAATNTQLRIVYRFGGGLNHNAPASSVRAVTSLNISFPKNPGAVTATQVRASVETINLSKGQDGEDAPDIEELRQQIPLAKKSQERIVSREDMIARVHSMPTNFGTVYRAAVRQSKTNPLSTELYVISRNADGKLTATSNTTKENLRILLDQYRLLTSGIDVLDARPINFSITTDIVIEPTLNKQTVMSAVLKRLRDFFRVQNFFIDQPIVLSEVRNSIFAVNGVMSITFLQLTNIARTYNGRSYGTVFDFDAATFKDVIVPPIGGIFELKYPEVDIIVRSA